VLVINHSAHEGYVGELEGCALPVLQDTVGDDVFGLYQARGYDLVAIGRHGEIDLVLHDVMPADDGAGVVAAVLEAWR
jgi:hypothetical protein